MKDNTLKVYYPGSGRLFLLHWWTYNGRGHVVLASSEASMNVVAEQVFRRHPDADIYDICEIEIVGPPKALSERVAAYLLEQEVNLFNMEVSRRLLDVVAAGKPLPRQFAVCKGYESKYTTEESDAYAKDHHYDCLHCVEGIQLVGTTTQELYQQYHDAWQAREARPRYIDPKLVVSKATPADDHEPLWYASAQFGHHSGGVVLTQLEVAETSIPYTPLFFFRRLRDLDQTHVRAMLTAQQQAAEQAKAVNERASMAKRQQRAAKEIEDTLTFFTQS